MFKLLAMIQAKKELVVLSVFLISISIVRSKRVILLLTVGFF